MADGLVRADLRAACGVAKAPTGIHGFDEVTRGGLPRARTTLVTGPAGSGKTLFGMEFLVRGAQEFGEPGVLMAFEESAGDITTNVASLGFDVSALERSGGLVVDAVRLEPTEIVTAGEFDLEGLFIRLGSAIDAVGARRVVLDTIDVLFLALGDLAIVRGELSRLFRWLKDRGVTTVVTSEKGTEGQLTRFGIEEYVSDCVISLDHRVQEEISTRRLHVVKYRGSEHGTNEYPFLVTDHGLLVLPITSRGLSYQAFEERIPSGIPGLDEVMGGGIFRGSTLLILGGAGTGKTTMAAHLADAACARGEQVVFISYEESQDQVIRNMRSAGIDLGRWVERGLLTVGAERSVALGLEAHLAALHRILEEQSPQMVVLDAIASLAHVGAIREVSSAVTRAIDLMKTRGVTAVLTTMAAGGVGESSAIGVSTLADALLLLRNVESGGELNRLLLVIKSRGTAHSNQVREFVITSEGARLVDVHLGAGGVLTGAARLAALAEQEAEAARFELDQRRRQVALARRTAETEAEISKLRAGLEAERSELELMAAAHRVGSAGRAARPAARQNPSRITDHAEETRDG